MYTSNCKKIISLLMTAVMFLTVLSVNLFAFAIDSDIPTMEIYNAASSADYHKYFNSVYSVTFLDKIDYDSINAAIDSWDVSENKDNSVIAWMQLNETATQEASANRYDVYIAGNGGVKANSTSSYIFYSFSALTEVNGLENFKTEDATTFYQMFGLCRSLISIDLSSWDTSNVTDLSYMFYQCESLTDVDLSNWNTSSTTNMSYMFYNCNQLKVLDLSSFDTSKVTTIKFMFYLCKNLEYIYAGDGWTTESVINLNDGVFNCCYAMFGGQENYESNSNPPVSAEYARFEEEGGYLTHVSEMPQPEKKTYTVTYEFEGDVIPDGATLTEPCVYEEGETVTVADTPYFDGYEFSGWTSSDADIETGSFVINNDVTIVGSWSVIYNVYYYYLGEVPEKAPELNSYSFKANEVVTVDNIPFVDNYVFVGWDSDDVTFTDGYFMMPEHDVYIYGYFKIPVESVEINGGDIVLNIDEETVINVIVKPEDATVKDIVFESSDESVVTVDKNGIVKTVGEGTAIITVFSTDDPTKKDEITVTVKVPVTGIAVDKEEIEFYKDATEKINVTVDPENATNKNVTFETSDVTVAAVDNEGNIIAVGEGTAKITVTSVDNPSVFEIIEVTVKIPVTEIRVTDDFTIEIGEEKNVEASVNEDASNKKLIYESENPEVVKIDNNGNVIGVGEGIATITVTSIDNPSIKETVTVTVVTPEIPVADIITDIKDITLEIGETDEITVTVTPDDATNKEVIFESSDDNVIIVDNYGNITAVGEGTATITVTSADNSTIKTTVTVTVTKPIIEEPSTEPEEPTTEPEEPTTEPEEPTTEPEEPTTEPEEPTTEPEEPTTEPEEPTTEPEEPATEPEEPTTEPEEPTTEPDEPNTEPDNYIEVPSEMTVLIGQTQLIPIDIPDGNSIVPTFTSSDESIVTVDADGNITGVGIGNATITVDLGNGDLKIIVVTVIAIPEIPVKHYICFGKTDGIGWYEVSVNGGDFFPQGPNSTLEVDKGSIVVVRVQDMWIDDDFTFYVNGKKVEKDAANCITVVVDGYMLIGALSMDVEVPDIEESLTLFEKLIRAIKAFFDMLTSWFDSV